MTPRYRAFVLAGTATLFIVGAIAPVYGHQHIRRLDSREVFGEIVGNGTRGEVKVFWHGAHADGSSFA